VRASTTVTLRVSSNVGQTATTSRTIVSANLPAGQILHFSPTTPGINDTVLQRVGDDHHQPSFTWDSETDRTGQASRPRTRNARGHVAVVMTVRNDLGQTGPPPHR
jgi:hypothetical protein